MSTETETETTDETRRTYTVSVTWEVEAPDPDAACDEILDELTEAGVAVYSVRVDHA